MPALLLMRIRMMRIQWLARLLLASTFLLLLVGGTVNPTGSSLACPDWPLCYGQVFPEMTNGVEYEHTHRMVATFVGLLTCALAFALWRFKPTDPGLRKLGVLSVTLVVLQGLLGGITVLFKLPPAISMTHLALSMFFFLVVLFIVLRTRTPEASRPSRTGEDSTTWEQRDRAHVRMWLSAALVAVYSQIVLGGIVRHTHSGLSCGTDAIFCAGQTWPHWASGQIQMLHRAWGLGVALLLVISSLRVWRTNLPRRYRNILWAVTAAPVIALIQIVLGAWTVWSGISLIPVTAHLGFGALLLALVAYARFEITKHRLELSMLQSPNRLPSTQITSTTQAPSTAS